MLIKINNEAIDFTLEKERALGEVVDGIQDWLKANGFAITAMMRDEEALTFTTRLEWQNDSIDEIESLEITARHPMDLAYDKLAAATQYLQLIEDEGTSDSPVIADLLKGMEDVAEMIDEVLPGTGEQTYGTQFIQLAAATGIPSDGPISQDGFRNFISYVSDLIKVVGSRTREIADPSGEIRALVPPLREILADVGSIAVLFQTGKDGAAVGKLIRLIEILQKLVRVVHYLGEQALLDLGILEIDGSTITDFTSVLNGFLRELSEAMETGDSVLIGDLLEYEIEPKLTGFLGALEANGIL